FSPAEPVPHKPTNGASPSGFLRLLCSLLGADYSGQEDLGFGRRPNMLEQNVSRAGVSAVEDLHSLAIGSHRSAIQRSSGEHALIARVAQDFSIDLPIDPCSSVVSNWSGNRSSVAANLKLI